MMPSTAAPQATFPRVQRTLRHDLAVLAILALAATALGFSLNRLRREPLPPVYVSKPDRLQRSVARLAPPTVSAPTAPEMIDLARFHALVENNALVLDARPAIFYRAGHVPGARGLSRAAFEQDYARLRPDLEPRRAETLAVYCAGDECEDSRLVAAALGRLGYPRVLIFQGGWEEWRQAGLPEERSR